MSDIHHLPGLDAYLTPDDPPDPDDCCCYVAQGEDGPECIDDDCRCRIHCGGEHD